MEGGEGIVLTLQQVPAGGNMAVCAGLLGLLLAQGAPLRARKRRALFQLGLGRRGAVRSVERAWMRCQATQPGTASCPGAHLSQCAEQQHQQRCGCD